MGQYMKQAAEYSSSVTTLDNQLSDALSQLQNVDNVLDLSTSNQHDVLSYNVISCNSAIKEEIVNLKSDLSHCVSNVSSKAAEIDARIERERLARLKEAQARLELENSSGGIRAEKV